MQGVARQLQCSYLSALVRVACINERTHHYSRLNLTFKFHGISGKAGGTACTPPNSGPLLLLLSSHVSGGSSSRRTGAGDTKLRMYAAASVKL